MPPYPKRNLFLLTSQFTRGAVASHGQVFWLGHHRHAPPSQFPSGIWRALRPYSDEFAQASHLFPFSAESRLYAPGHPRPYSVFYRHHTMAAVFPSTGGRRFQKKKSSQKAVFYRSILFARRNLCKISSKYSGSGAENSMRCPVRGCIRMSFPACSICPQVRKGGFFLE